MDSGRCRKSAPQARVNYRVAAARTCSSLTVKRKQVESSASTPPDFLRVERIHNARQADRRGLPSRPRLDNANLWTDNFALFFSLSLSLSSSIGLIGSQACPLWHLDLGFGTLQPRLIHSLCPSHSSRGWPSPSSSSDTSSAEEGAQPRFPRPCPPSPTPPAALDPIRKLNILLPPPRNKATTITTNASPMRSIWSTTRRPGLGLNQSRERVEKSGGRTRVKSTPLDEQASRRLGSRS